MSRVLHIIPKQKENSRGGIIQAVEDIASIADSSSTSHGIDSALPSPNSSESPQAVHFHGIWQPSYRPIIKELVRQHTPFAISPHGMLEPWPKKHKGTKKAIYYHLIEKHHLRKATSILATSNLEKSNLPLEHQEKCHIIPLGIDTRASVAASIYAPTDPSYRTHPINLLYLSRIDPKKGLDTLILGISGLTKAQRTHIMLHVVGDGCPQYTQKLKALAERQQLSITWHGPAWGALKWTHLKHADMLCLPSKSENFGFVYLESLSMGTPIMTTKHTPWAQHQKREILTVEPNPKSIQNTLERYLQEKHSSNQLPEHKHLLKKWAFTHHHYPHLKEKYQQFYRQLLMHHEAQT